MKYVGLAQDGGNSLCHNLTIKLILYWSSETTTYLVIIIVSAAKGKQGDLKWVTYSVFQTYPLNTKL